MAFRFHFAHPPDKMPRFNWRAANHFRETKADTMSSSKDQYKEKFRPDSDSALDRELSAALGGVELEKLYGFDKPQEKTEQSTEQLAAKGLRRGKIVSIGKDDVFVDLGGKSQGIASLTQFENVPTVGEEMEFHVERYDPREGLLILTRKGALASNVSWDNLEIGQIVEGAVTGMNKGGLELQVKSMRAFSRPGRSIWFSTRTSPPSSARDSPPRSPSSIGKRRISSSAAAISWSARRKRRGRKCSPSSPRDQSAAAASPA